MNWINSFRKRRAVYEDLSEEIRDHLEEKTRELIESGVGPEEAAAQAKREFGNVALTEERGCVIWRWITLEDCLSDLGSWARRLPTNPGFAFVAVLIVIQGIGTE